MFHRRAPRHGAPPATPWARLARILHTAPAGAVPVDGSALEEEPVRPVGPGFLRQRPGGVFEDTLLGPADRPTAPLHLFQPGAEVWTTDQAEGLRAGMHGRVVRVLPWRPARRIGVRMDAPGWAPLAWFDEREIDMRDPATAITAAIHLGLAPTMAGAR